MPGVLVFCELQDGTLKKAARECLSAAGSLASAAGGDVSAFVAGSAARSAAEQCGKFGVRRLFVAGDALDQYTTESYTAAMAEAIQQASPSIVLIPGTANGRDLAPRLAARLGVGVASDVTSLEWTDGRLVARRFVYSGKAIATVAVTGSPAIATVRPNALPLSQPTGDSMPEVVSVTASSDSRVKVVETRAPEAGEASLTESDIIVTGGRGLKEAANFSYIRELAHAIGGAVGASRATVDAGWIDHQHQVGQTGRVVSPNLYIAAGVSGAIQHLAGMSSSKHIIAINKDPEAPIFRIADLGVVGDLFTILPALTEEVKKAKAH
jgi:electron transfer flavoprotein alpha subunit